MVFVRLHPEYLSAERIEVCISFKGTFSENKDDIEDVASRIIEWFKTYDSEPHLYPHRVMKTGDVVHRPYFFRALASYDHSLHVVMSFSANDRVRMMLKAGASFAL